VSTSRTRSPGNKSRSGALLLVSLARGARSPVHRQLYDAVRAKILDGSLAPGARLPSTRALAEDLRVSRSTVVRAFDQLAAEGYIDSTKRGSTRVTRQLPDALTRAAAAPTARKAPMARMTSARAHLIDAAWPPLPLSISLPPRPFRTSVPALDIFPMEIWGRLMSRRWQRASPATLAYGDPQGAPPLREAIAAYLTAARGVRCSAANIVVTAGSQQALDIVARTLLGTGDTVWMEDPGYSGAASAFASAGATLVPVPVDEEGLSVVEGVRRAPNAKLAFVTPARQMPLGITMSLRRRLDLLAWAASHQAWILEDDYDSEFRYSTRPLAALQGLDEHESVIFVGTFSKVTLPALRLGYLVVPDRLIEPLVTVRRAADFCSPPLMQLVMADFMAAGHFERHIRRMRAIYRARRQMLTTLIERALGGLVEVDAPDAGMNLIVWLPPALSDTAVAAALYGAGIDALPMSKCSIENKMRPGLLLGFSGVREADLKSGVAVLQRVVGALAKRA
jgi:GntR family transcriptional regulator/MocR family aminotransferase